MSVHWIRAIHRVLERETVLPADAVQHYPGWEPVGEPSTDPDALRAELAAEQSARAADAAEGAAGAEAAALSTPQAPVSPAAPPAVPEQTTDLPDTTTSHDGDPKEQ